MQCETGFSTFPRFHVSFFGCRHLLYGSCITFNRGMYLNFPNPQREWQTNSSSVLTTNTCATSILAEWKVGSVCMCVFVRPNHPTSFACVSVTPLSFTLYSVFLIRFSMPLPSDFDEHASNLCRWHTSVQFEVENRWCNVTAPTNCPEIVVCRARLFFLSSLHSANFEVFGKSSSEYNKRRK